MMILFRKLSYLTALIITLSAMNNPAVAAAKDDPLLTKVMVEQLEWRDSEDSSPLVLDGQVWFGKDLQKLWLKTEIESEDSETEEAELHALYSQAVAPYWDIQVGLRANFQPTPRRNWAVLGLQGLAPYFFEVDAALYLGDNGAAFRLEAEYELMFTQRLILSPEIELNIHSESDSDTGVGSGLTSTEIGLRLRYEIRREMAPYIGVNFTNQYGKTADLAELSGEETDDIQLVIGVRSWF